MNNNEMNTNGFGNKIRNGFRNVKARIGRLVLIKTSPVLIIIIVILLAAALIAGITDLISLFGNSNESNVAVQSAIEKSIKIASTDSGEYYYKISKDIVDEFLDELNKAYERGEYEVELDLTFKDDDYEWTEREKENQIKESTSSYEAEFTVNTLEDWFNTDNRADTEAYLVKMIRAEYESTHPKLGNYKGEADSEDKQGNKKDKDGDYVAQGVIQIKRTKLIAGGTGVVIKSPNGKAVTDSENWYNGMQYIEVLPTEMKDNLPLVVFLPGDGGWEFLEESRASQNGKFAFMQNIENGGVFESEECIFIVPDYKAGTEKNTMELIESVAQEYNVDRSRIILTGGSRGSMGAQKLLKDNPRYFALGILMSGYYAPGVNPEDLTDTPIIAYSGTVDDSLSVNEMMKLSEAVNDKGGNFSFNALDGYDHDGLETGTPNILTSDDVWDIIYSASRENPTEIRPNIDTTSNEHGPKNIRVGAVIDLKYMAYNEYVNNVNSKSSAVMNYFTFQEDKPEVIYYATYRQTSTTVNGEQKSYDYFVNGNNPLSLKSITNLCGMPYNFLFALLQTAKNANYVMAVADLALDETEVVLMIQDQLNVNEIIQDKYKVERTQNQAVTFGANVSIIGRGETVSSFKFPASEEDKEETINTTYTNTTTAYVNKAKTWCMDFEEEAQLSVTSTNNTNTSSYNESQLGGLAYTLTSSNEGQILGYFSGLSKEKLDQLLAQGINTTLVEVSLSDSYVLHSTTTINTNATWNIGTKTDKEINEERFLGLWKNEYGVYKKGAPYKADGIEVAYSVTPDLKNSEKEYPARNITSSQDGEDIDNLIELLSRYEDTQLQEQLMMYYWNIYTKQDVYKINIKDTLELFDSDSFRNLADSIMQGDTNLEKLYFALLDAGYSKNTAAGSIAALIIYGDKGSGNNTQDVLKISEEEYITSIDDGSYNEFAKDGISFGIGQWSSTKRKEGLLKYAKSKGTSIGDEDMQIEYLLAEVDITGSSPASSFASYQLTRYGEDWREAETPEAAAVYFYADFLKGLEDTILDNMNINNGTGSILNITGQVQGKIPAFVERKRIRTSEGTYEGGGYKFPSFLQKDFMGTFGTSTIDASGCGPTSLAIALSGLLGYEVTPIEIVEKMESYWPNYRTYYWDDTGSTNMICDEGFLSQFEGIEAVYRPVDTQGWSRSDALNEITNNGASAVLFTPGHIVSMVPPTDEQKMEGYQFQIIDPNWPERNGAFKSMADYAAFLSSQRLDGETIAEHELLFWGLLWNEEDKANGGPSGNTTTKNNGRTIEDGIWNLRANFEYIYNNAKSTKKNPSQTIKQERM